MELGLTLGGEGDSFCADVSSCEPFNRSFNLALALGVNSGVTSNHQRDSRPDADPTASISSSCMHLDLFPLWSPDRQTPNTGYQKGGSPGVAVEAVEAISSPNYNEDRQLATSPRASYEDENDCSRKKLRLSKEQAAFLEESFKQHNTLNIKQKHALAKQLNLRPRQVEVWFQNRRARTKLKQTEVEYEYLKRCCETLTAENRRLHKELQELRALKSSHPYYSQQPVTTLTMCPSCECTTTATSSASAVTSVVLKNTSEPSSKLYAPFPFSRPKIFPFSSIINPKNLWPCKEE